VDHGVAPFAGVVGHSIEPEKPKGKPIRRYFIFSLKPDLQPMLPVGSMV
jgi:hypothetical protein